MNPTNKFSSLAQKIPFALLLMLETVAPFNTKKYTFPEDGGGKET